MTKNVHDDRIQIDGIGEVSKLPGSLAGSSFWVGTFPYNDHGELKLIDLYICAEDDSVPSNETLAFVSATIRSFDSHVESARRLAGERLHLDPGFFGLEAHESAKHLTDQSKLLPFGHPEPTFYGVDDWQIRFAESAIPRCSDLGVSVVFVGWTPDRIEELSEDPMFE